MDLDISYDYIEDWVLVESDMRDGINISDTDRSIAGDIRVNINYKTLGEFYWKKSIKVK